MFPPKLCQDKQLQAIIAWLWSKGWWFKSAFITLCFMLSFAVCGFRSYETADSQNITINARGEEAQVQNPWRRDGIAHDKNCQLCFLCFESCLWPHVWGERVGLSFYCKLCQTKSTPHGKSSCERNSNHHKTVRWLLITSYEYNFNFLIKFVNDT